MEKLYLFSVHTFCKSQYDIRGPIQFTMGSGDPIYVLYLYDQMWLVGLLSRTLFKFHYFEWLVLNSSTGLVTAGTY